MSDVVSVRTKSTLCARRARRSAATTLVVLAIVGVSLGSISGGAVFGSHVAFAAQREVVVPPLPPVPPFPPFPPIPPMTFAPLTSSSGPFGVNRLEYRQQLHDGRWLHVRVRGDVELTADERDVARVSDGGYVEIAITSRRWLSRSGWRYQIRADSAGTQSRHFVLDGRAAPIDAAARTRIEEAIQRYLIDTGFDAPRRVARLLASGGADRVLDHIGTMSNDHAKAVYVAVLFEQARPDGETARRAMRQARSVIRSDFALARVLTSVLPAVSQDDATVTTFVEIAQSIHSDFEKARVLTALMQQGPPRAPVQRLVFDGVRSIHSDFEKSRVLAAAVQRLGLDHSTREPFFRAVRAIRSDFERHRVLVTLLQRERLADEDVLGIAQDASRIGSDFHKAQVLLRLAQRRGDDAATREALLEAARHIRSDHHRGQVLSAMLMR